MARPALIAAALLALHCALIGVGVAADEPTPTWQRVPQSSLRHVLPVPPVAGMNVPEGMIQWSSAAVDTKRSRLHLTGGGHGDYAGNEVYRLDLEALLSGRDPWARVLGPSRAYEGQLTDRSANNDGSPVAVHVYDGIVYAENADATFRVGGSVWPGGASSWATWRLDADPYRWTRQAQVPSGGYLGEIAKYDPVTGLIWVRSYNVLQTFDPLKNVWTDHVSPVDEGLFDGVYSGALDPERGLLFIVGGNQGAGKVFVYDLRAPRPLIRHTWVTTGPQDIVNAVAPGLVYDPSLKQIVGYNGGADIFTLDPHTRAWTRHRGVGTPPGPPMAGANPLGIFGRFNYFPKEKIYVYLPGTVDADVWVMSLSGRPLPTGVALPRPGEWVARPLGAPVPSAGTQAVPTFVKHTRAAYRPPTAAEPDGRIWYVGGDRYSLAVPAHDGNGNTEVWSLGVAKGDWRLEIPFCTSPAPGLPDNVTWVYVESLDRFFIAPGYYFGVRRQRALCPGTEAVFEPLLANPIERRWERPTPTPLWPPDMPGFASVGDNGGKHGVFDPVTNSIYRADWDGAWGNQIQQIDFRDGRWHRHTIGGNHRSYHLESEDQAIDVTGRWIYWIHAATRELVRWHIDSRTFEVVATLPREFLMEGVDTANIDPGETATPIERNVIVFDPTNRVLLMPNNGTYVGWVEALFVWHVDGRRWEVQAVPAGVQGVLGAFDSKLGVLVLVGGHGGQRLSYDPARRTHVPGPRQYFLYRYGPAPANPAPIAPPSP